MDWFQYFATIKITQVWRAGRLGEVPVASIYAAAQFKEAYTHNTVFRQCNIPVSFYDKKNRKFG
jgi:hypothetical protein